MLTKQELKDILTSEGILTFETDTFSDDGILLDSNNLYELISFIKANCIPTVFYNYMYYDKASYLLSEEDVKNSIESYFSIKTLSEFESVLLNKSGISNEVFKNTDDVCSYVSEPTDEDDDCTTYFIISDLGLDGISKSITRLVTDYIYELMSDIISNFNLNIIKADINKPYALSIYSIYEGEHVGIVLYDAWLDDYVENYNMEDVIYNFIVDNILIISKEIQYSIDYIKAEISKQKNKEAEENSKLDSLMQEFKEFLLNDPEFLKCTNEKLRRYYAKNLFKRTDTKHFEVLFVKRYMLSGEYYIDESDLKSVIELVWKTYKNKL